MLIHEIPLGSWGELLGAVAAMASAVLSAVALLLAHNANKTARIANEQAEKREREAVDRLEARERDSKAREEERDRRAAERDRQAQAMEEQRDARERDRDRRRIAGSLQVWWGESKTHGWGVVISNSGSTPSVFYNLQISATGNQRDQQSISIASVPPGVLFVRSKERWDLPVAESLANIIPITSSAAHRITSLEFDDVLGTHWIWTPGHGLEELRSTCSDKSGS